MPEQPANEGATPAVKSFDSGRQRLTYRCPHCRERAIVRATRELSPIYAERYLQCSSPTCGYTYVVGIEVIRTLSPSGTPNPELQIPQSTNPCAGKAHAASPTS